MFLKVVREHVKYTNEGLSVLQKRNDKMKKKQIRTQS